MSRPISDYSKLFLRPFYYFKMAVKVMLRMKRPFRSLWIYLLSNRAEYTYVFRNNLQLSTGFREEGQVVFDIFFQGTYGEVGTHQTIIDIGSNIGVFTLYAAYERKNTVLAFEPSPANFKRLETNLERNTSSGNITIVNKAVGSKRGAFLMASNLGVYSKLYRETERAKSQEVVDLVDCITLEDIFNEYGIQTCDLLKIDCEGFEYDILFFAPSYLFKRIAEIRMECDSVDEQRNKATMQEFLKSMGYRITHDRSSVIFAKRTEDSSKIKVEPKLIRAMTVVDKQNPNSPSSNRRAGGRMLARESNP